MIEVKRCLHCGDELVTSKERQNKVCSSCAVALVDDDYFEQMMSEAEVKMKEEG